MTCIGPYVVHSYQLIKGLRSRIRRPMSSHYVNEKPLTKLEVLVRAKRGELIVNVKRSMDLTSN